jgi:hypothetical protein
MSLLSAGSTSMDSSCKGLKIRALLRQLSKILQLTWKRNGGGGDNFFCRFQVSHTKLTLVGLSLVDSAV